MLVYKKEKQIIHGESDLFLFLLFKESAALRIAPLLRSSRNSAGHSESADLPKANRCFLMSCRIQIQKPPRASTAASELGSLISSYYAFRFRASDILLLRATSYSPLAAVRSADSRFPACLPYLFPKALHKNSASGKLPFCPQQLSCEPLHGVVPSAG